MPILIGVLFGRLFMKIAFSRAILTLLLWATVWGTASGAGAWVFGRGGGWIMGCAVTAALLAWSLWQPARSRIKIWMLDGVYILLRLGMIGVVLLTIVRFLSDKGTTTKWVDGTLPFVLVGVAICAAQHWLAGLLARSSRRGDKSGKPLI